VEGQGTHKVAVSKEGTDRQNQGGKTKNGTEIQSQRGGGGILFRQKNRSARTEKKGAGGKEKAHKGKMGGRVVSGKVHGG